MLLLYGSRMVRKDWHVKEEEPVLYCRVYYVQDGHVVYKEEHTEKLLKKGHIYVFPSNKPYEMVQDPENRLQCLYLHIEIAPYLVSELVELSVEQDSFLMCLFDAMERWIAEHPYRGQRSLGPVMENLAVAFVSFMNSMNLLQNVPEQIRDAIQYIDEHINEHITLSDLSELCGYNKQYFIRIFHASLGTTPHQYIIKYRMNRALFLLRKGYSVSETADMAGYSEVRNFIRAFHKYYGHSPGKIMTDSHLII